MSATNPKDESLGAIIMGGVFLLWEATFLIPATAAVLGRNTDTENGGDLR
ncbi:MAG TPA: hypothetical protein VFX16_10475 [Pseudonocardiaceae bacterium]|nr:hypothetical protein [Pseudonocardiaceae bacterium]